MTAYYNEFDPAAAALLEHLIADGVIAPGVVDTRSIKDVQPNDLRGFTQCHFFAGGGLWSVAARLAGWPDARPFWSGSCPCQPFNPAGNGLGTDDPRHLWPDFYRLISACRPTVVVGEQVAGKAGYGWLDGVRADLATEGYSSRGVDIPACAVDAPHQRNRVYWVALDDSRGHGQLRSGEPVRAGRQPPDNADGEGYLADRVGFGRQVPPSGWEPAIQGAIRNTHPHRNGSAWADSIWLDCHDGKARRAKPGVRLLVDGLPGRVDLWRVGGNAIVPVLAAEVLGALLETELAAA